MSNNIDLEAMRHSCQHVLAQAMYDLYPGVKMAMGPATKEGFYGDFDLPDGVSVSVDDLPKIEEQMQKISRLYRNRTSQRTRTPGSNCQYTQKNVR